MDLGDTPQGASDDWVNKRLPLPRERKYRGDGTREELERVARETGVFIVTGLVEKSGGTLYCGVVYVCPKLGILGKRRKVMPTGSERLVWGQGAPSTLRAVTTEIKGVRICMAAAICWENYMPLLRQSLYCQNVNLWFAPTADARPTWEGLMRTVGIEGRCFVMSANQCVRKKNLPGWITEKEGESKKAQASDKVGTGPSAGARVNGVPDKEFEHAVRARRRSTITITEDKHEICWPVVEGDSQSSNLTAQNGDTSAIDDESSAPLSSAKSLSKPKSILDASSTTNDAATTSSSANDDFECRGGSCIISPFGDVLAGPLWEVEDGGLLVTEVDFEDCERGRLDLDVAGSYSRMDSFRLSVEGLDLNPPP